MWSTVLELVGAVCVIAGLAMLAPWLALVVGGIILFAVGNEVSY